MLNTFLSNKDLLHDMIRIAVFIFCIVIGLLITRSAVSKKRKFVLVLLTIIYIIVPVYYTFFSRMDLSGRLNAFRPNEWQNRFLHYVMAVFKMRIYYNYIADIMNVLLFIPVGYILTGWFRLSKHHRRNVFWPLLIAAILSGCIELMQGYTGLGVCDFTDWLCNTLGAVIGITALSISLIKRKKKRKS